MKTLVTFGLVLSASALAAHASEKEEEVQRFAMNPFHANIGRVVEVAANGTIKVADVANPRFALARNVAGQPDLTEGFYLGLVAGEFALSTKDTRLVKVQVTEVGKKGEATLRVSSAAAPKIKPGEQIVFFRPPGSSTAELKAAPEFAPVDDGTKTSVLGKDAVNAAARLTQSRNNLKQIGLAMHNFHDTYRRFPPAVVYGPDGKPWHSWRVLILPFIEQAPLYNQYKFDEPWDGPNNKKLLSLMPETYRDPIYGKTDDYFTHYAAVTGEGTAFPTEGVRLEDPKKHPLAQPAEKLGWALSFRNFTDGTSNCVMVGPVSPDRKIPWMKPEDVVVGEEFPKLGEKGGFAAPYESDGAKSGVFLFADGAVRSLPADFDQQVFLNMLHIADGKPIPALPGVGRPKPRPGVRAAQFIEIVGSGDDVRARLVVGRE